MAWAVEGCKGQSQKLKPSRSDPSPLVEKLANQNIIVRSLSLQGNKEEYSWGYGMRGIGKFWPLITGAVGIGETLIPSFHQTSNHWQWLRGEFSLPEPNWLLSYNMGGGGGGGKHQNMLLWCSSNLYNIFDIWYIQLTHCIGGDIQCYFRLDLQLHSTGKSEAIYIESIHAFLPNGWSLKHHNG